MTRPTTLAGAAMAFAMSVTTVSAQEITVAGAGGSLAKIITEVFEKPLADESGITVKAVASTERVAALKAMFAANNPIWDVTELSGSEYPIVLAEGWLEPFDWNEIDPEGRVPDEHRAKNAVPYASFSVVLAQRLDALPKGKKMAGWADFWDTGTFPGPRGLRDTPQQNLEFALLANGVPAGDIYTTLATEEGVDRAFAKLDEIKDDVVLWWKSGAQPIQAMADGEVHYTTGFNGRFTVLNNEGTPNEIVWNGGALLKAFLAPVKGTKNRGAALKYLSYIISSPERAAEFAKRIPYPGFTSGLYDFIDADQQRNMPTYPANLESQFVFDDAFWVENRDALTERWQSWVLE